MGQAVQLDERTLELVRTYAQLHGLTIEAALGVLVVLGHEPRVSMRRREGAWVFDVPSLVPSVVPSSDNHAPCTPCSMTPESSSPAV